MSASPPIQYCDLCKGPLEGGRVLFVCPCANSYCVNCCLRGLSTYRKTYHYGTPCPACKEESENIEGKVEAFGEENRLIRAAFGRLLGHLDLDSSKPLEEEDYITAFKELKARIVPRKNDNEDDLDIRDLLEYARDLTLVDLKDEDMEKLGRMYLKLNLARVEHVLQSGEKVKQGEFVYGPLHYITFRRDNCDGDIVNSIDEIEKTEKTPSSTTSPATTMSIKNCDDEASLNNLVGTSAFTSDPAMAMGTEGDEANLGMLVHMLRRTQEQLGQVMKRSDEQFALLLTKSEEQNSRLRSLERKINQLTPNQENMDTSSPSSPPHIDVVTQKKCAFVGCQEFFSTAPPHSKREFCDTHSPWRQFCISRKDSVQPIGREATLNDHSTNAAKNDDPVSDENDDFCHVCRYGGDLILCDYCTFSYHINCAGLNCAPQGEFKCPKCCDENEEVIKSECDERPMKQCEYEGCSEILYTQKRGKSKKWCDYHRTMVKIERDRQYKIRKKEEKERGDYDDDEKYEQFIEYHDNVDTSRDFFYSYGVKQCSYAKCTARIGPRCKYCTHHSRLKKRQRDRERNRRRGAENQYNRMMEMEIQKKLRVFE